MKFISPLQEDKGPISSASKAEMEEEETQDESEETLVPRLNHRPRKTTKASRNFKNYQAWDWLILLLDSLQK